VRLVDELELDFDPADADSELLSLDDLLGEPLPPLGSAAPLRSDAAPLVARAPGVSRAERPLRRGSQDGIGDLADDIAWLGVQVAGLERELGQIHSAVERLEQAPGSAPAGRARSATEELLDAIEQRLGRLEGKLESGGVRTRDQIEETLQRSHWRLVLIGSAALVALGVLLLRG
jgi:ElaB/YqjD/DUF883 family membrane-anchored ribosome-binding protein